MSDEYKSFKRFRYHLKEPERIVNKSMRWLQSMINFNELLMKLFFEILQKYKFMFNLNCWVASGKNLNEFRIKQD